MRAKDFITELGKSAKYKNPIGIMEFYKFMQVATVEQKNEMKRLMGMQKYDEAWNLLQQVTGTKLSEAEKNTVASDEIYAALKDSGYKLLGSGEDATVWAKKSGPVIKIIMPSDGQGAGPSGDTFMKFYEFCKENSSLENLPNFSGGGAEVFEADEKSYVMVTMERLKPIPRYSFQEAMVWILSDLSTKRISWEKALQLLKDKNTWQYFDEGMNPAKVLSTINQLDERGLLEYEVLFKLMTLLYHRGKINKVGWDLHTENVMMRDETLVITDPWFNLETRS